MSSLLIIFLLQMMKKNKPIEIMILKINSRKLILYHNKNIIARSAFLIKAKYMDKNCNLLISLNLPELLKKIANLFCRNLNKLNNKSIYIVNRKYKLFN